MENLKFPRHEILSTDEFIGVFSFDEIYHKEIMKKKM